MAAGARTKQLEPKACDRSDFFLFFQEAHITLVQELTSTFCVRGSLSLRIPLAAADALMGRSGLGSSYMDWLGFVQTIGDHDLANGLDPNGPDA